MTFLIIVGLIVALIWALNRNPVETPAVKSKIYQLNQQWVDFVAGYNNLAKTNSEKALLSRMLSDLMLQGMPAPSIPTYQPTPSTQQISQMTAATVSPATATTASDADQTWAEAPSYAVNAPTRPPIDNAMILLYFGAFLLVAAAGLFVAFGGASGGVRTFIIAIVAAMMYCGGFWLWYSKPKLKQAAFTFIGIGIVLVPLAGLAAYSYVFNDAGRVVWLVTSLICLAVYSHALWVLKTPLLEYVFIGTFVSLFESAVAIMHAPVYYFGWGLAAVGILVQAEQLIRRGKPEYDQPSTVSASVLLPLALLVALWMVPSHGTAQLGVSLLLASLYYALLAWRSSDEIRTNGFVAAQVLFLSAAAIFAYGPNHSLPHAAVALMILAIPQLAWILLQKGQLAQNGASVMLTSLVFATVLASQSPMTMLMAALSLATASTVVWLRQKRDGGYHLAVGALATVVLVLGYRVLTTIEPAQPVVLLLLALIAAQLAVFYWVRLSERDSNEWRVGFRATFIATLAVASIIAFMMTPAQLVVFAVAAALCMAPLLVHDSWTQWSTLSGLIIATPIPMLVAVDKPGLILTVTLLALAWNSLLSWWLMAEQCRSLSVVLWLLVPFAIAHAAPNIAFQGYYAVAYALVASILLGIRAYVIWRPRMITHSSFGEGGSYVVGYIFASVIAVVSASFGPRFLPVAICAVVALIAYVASVYVEKHTVLVAPIPALAQIGLWATYETGQMVPYLLLSSTLAAIGYGFYSVAGQRPTPGTRGYYVQLMSLLALFVPVAVYLGGNVWWPMPWAFLFASLAVLDYVWARGQSQRELAGGLMLLAIFTGMHFYGVRNIQAYAHVAAALGASYAYWRAHRDEADESDQYIMVTLAVVTIPLLIQALIGTAGDMYGWWLLIEQIVIMLLGMLLGKKLMVRWGLYVALGSVLYQLRHLGWAALALVAVFLIGLGVYYLQKVDKTTDGPVK